VITPTRSLVLCAESRREMEDWLAAMKAASTREFFEPGPLDQHDFLSNYHHWYKQVAQTTRSSGPRPGSLQCYRKLNFVHRITKSLLEIIDIYVNDYMSLNVTTYNNKLMYATSHARPTYCNVCRDALSGVTSHGLSCEVCKCKVHKRCAAKAIPNCKWTTLASVGKDIIEDDDGNIIMPHQWMEGNLPVSSTCIICKKTCGRTTVHTACRPHMKVKCPLGSAHVSVIPPTSVHSIGIDEAWDVVKPQGSYSPLLVFVNSKSGDNQGVKFLRRFKQLLNPAQVFDLVSAGPGLGLRLFRHFDPFRILVCSGDGSVGWVLSEIDRLDMNKQCQLAVLPLGTGNDLARVLGWGSACDDDAHLPQILERYESASTKMLDRWSIMVFEKAIALKTPKMSMSLSPELMLKEFEELINLQLQSIIETEDFDVVISSTKMLCESVNDFIARVADHCGDEEQLNIKCDILRQKLDMLLETLKEENNGALSGDDLMKTLNDIARKSATERPLDSVTNKTKSSIGKTEKDELNTKERRSSRVINFSEKEALQCRANSLKRAITNLIQHSEMLKPSEKRYSTQVDNLCVFTSSSSDASPWASPVPPINIISPSVSTTHLTCISPLDLRRGSMDEYFFNDLSLPVPRQFADGSSRRSSEVIKEEMKGHQESVDATNGFPFCTDNKKSESKATSNINVDYDSEASLCRLEYLQYSTSEQREDGFGFIPFEVYERNKLRNQQNLVEQATVPLTASKTTASNNLLQVPLVMLPPLEIERPPPKHENVYVSDSITLIDTDPPEKSSSDDIPGEASDVLSAISNEECSVNSEILDKQLDSLSQIHIADIIQ
ncbi:Diacylglycerol kinase eta, partial [Pseudolycoriella hygida]